MVMSRVYDAKQWTLKAFPNDREAAVKFFLGYCDIREVDFKYEFNQSPEEYIFGDIEKHQE
jgi:hypothetical protein